MQNITIEYYYTEKLNQLAELREITSEYSSLEFKEILCSEASLQEANAKNIIALPCLEIHSKSSTDRLYGLQSNIEIHTLIQELL